MQIIKKAVEDLGATFTGSVELCDLTSSALINNARISESLKTNF